jgi:hypothetical protein
VPGKGRPRKLSEPEAGAWKSPGIDLYLTYGHPTET